MNMQSLITIGAALVAGAAGGVVVSGSSGGGDVPTTILDLHDLRAELEELQSQNREMQSRIDMLEMLPDVSSVAPAARTSVAEEESLAEKERMLDELLGRMSQADDGATVPPNLTDQVKQVYADIRREEEEAREKEREQRRKDAFDDRINRYAKELGLNAYQTNQMHETLTKEALAFETAREKIREAGDFSGMRDAMATIRTTTRDSLGTFLSHEQMQKYDEMSGGDRAFFRGFDGAGRGDRGGGRRDR